MTECFSTTYNKNTPFERLAERFPSGADHDCVLGSDWSEGGD